VKAVQEICNTKQSEWSEKCINVDAYTWWGVEEHRSG